MKVDNQWKQQSGYSALPTVYKGTLILDPQLQVTASPLKATCSEKKEFSPQGYSLQGYFLGFELLELVRCRVSQMQAPT